MHLSKRRVRFAFFPMPAAPSFMRGSARNIVKGGLIAATVMLGAPLGAVNAHAAVITFDTAPAGAYLTAPITEDGFTYSVLSGGLFVDQFGNPGNSVEGSEFFSHSVLNIVSAGSLPDLRRSHISLALKARL